MDSALTIFAKGAAMFREEHAAAEVKKLYTLRGGSAGCLLPNGDIIGNNIYQTLGRFIGFQISAESQQPYFDLGIANEYIWENNCNKAAAEFGYDAVLCEENIPVRLNIAEGFDLTGRPDLVFCKEAAEDDKDQVGVYQNPKDGKYYKAAFGLELKGMGGIKSAADKLVGERPDDKHLCQAALYMRLLGDITFSITYTGNISGPLDYFRKKDYGQDSLAPGKNEFLIEWREDILWYRKPTGDWVKTLITWEGILNYYKRVLEMYETKKLGRHRISGVYADRKSVPFDKNMFDDWNLMVPNNQGWEAFVEYAHAASLSKYKIKYEKKRYHIYPVAAQLLMYEHKMPKSLHSCRTLTEARDYVFPEVGLDFDF